MTSLAAAGVVVVVEADDYFEADDFELASDGPGAVVVPAVSAWRASVLFSATAAVPITCSTASFAEEVMVSRVDVTSFICFWDRPSPLASFRIA